MTLRLRLLALSLRLAAPCLRGGGDALHVAVQTSAFLGAYGERDGLTILKVSTP